ncbi:hypothetical protein DFP72DRAFT_920551 [Ephemerocybe angulata]|uniref:Uncharacterized protein n=1 Tax=Ephemerocybe angulata TaxID=980116 RepID=A0A8H6LX09_9AGAR|nr:hypothetical protein DFP72DRAFT_920551 [Tulosesus angulatus]
MMKMRGRGGVSAFFLTFLFVPFPFFSFLYPIPLSFFHTLIPTLISHPSIAHTPSIAYDNVSLTAFPSARRP